MDWDEFLQNADRLTLASHWAVSHITVHDMKIQAARLSTIITGGIFLVAAVGKSWWLMVLCALILIAEGRGWQREREKRSMCAEDMRKMLHVLYEIENPVLTSRRN